jgi:uncharacterized protein YbjT (DUF2867 family)
MRVFVAGATGVIGVRLVPLLISEGHLVAGMTRSPTKESELAALGAEPIVCDAFDLDRLTAALRQWTPDVVVDELTDLPDHVELLGDFSMRNDRMRTEGTHNLVAAARAGGARHFVAQSIAWRPPGREQAVEQLEAQVLAIGGVVVRYGQLYGDGTFYERELPPAPRVHVDTAARAVPPLLEAPSGIFTVVDPDT